MSEHKGKRLEKAAEIMANNPTMPKSKALLIAGYSPATAREPGKLLRVNKTKWEKLMEKHMNDKLLAQRTNDLINAQRKKTTYIKGAVTEVVDEIDTFAVSKGLEFAFKLKNKYPADKHEVEHRMVIPLLDVTTHRVEQIDNN